MLFSVVTPVTVNDPPKEVALATETVKALFKVVVPVTVNDPPKVVALVPETVNVLNTVVGPSNDVMVFIPVTEKVSI